MDTMIAAKKGTGIDDLFKGYESQQLEEQSQVKITETAAGTLEGYVNLYKSCLNETFMIEEILPKMRNPLTPQKIREFVKATAPQGYPEREKKEWPPTRREPGIGIMFLNQLIQTSYDSGLNDFTLCNVEFPHLGNNFHGRKDNPLRIKIEGNVSYNCFQYAHYLDIAISGNAGASLGFGTEDSSFLIERDFGIWIGATAQRCQFYLGGKVIYDSGGGGWRKDCTFIMTHKKSLHWLRGELEALERKPDDQVSFHESSGNKIYFISRYFGKKLMFDQSNSLYNKK